MKKIVDKYTHGHAPVVVQLHAMRTAETNAAAVVQLLRPGDNLLDVGCGPGSITKGFKKYVGERGRVVGLDAEPKVVAEATIAVGDDAEIIQGSAYELPFESNAFDVVHAHQVLQHLKDPIAALKEMKRVSNGLVICREVDYESWLWYPETSGMTKWKQAYRDTCKRNGADSDAGRKLKAWYREAGFDIITTSSSTVQYCGKESTVAFGETWAKRVAETQLGDQMESYGLATRQEINDMAEAWRAWGQHQDAMLFYVDVCAIGRKL